MDKTTCMYDLASFPGLPQFCYLVGFFFGSLSDSLHTNLQLGTTIRMYTPHADHVICVPRPSPFVSALPLSSYWMVGVTCHL